MSPLDSDSNMIQVIAIPISAINDATVTDAKDTTEAEPRLRWYQYSLASLFVLVVLVAIPCSWFRCKMVEA